MSYLILVTGAYRDFARQSTCAVTAVRLDLFFVVHSSGRGAYYAMSKTSLGNGSDKGAERCSTRAGWIMAIPKSSKLSDHVFPINSVRFN
jgi:hypothetical protein